MKLLHYLVSLTLLVMLTACETQRVNHDKTKMRPISCNVPDRCGITQ